jgi:hypothetical protein
VSGSELVVTTPGGTVSITIEFATVVIVSDFDGGGVRESWVSYGDVASFNAATPGGPTGNYAALTWLVLPLMVITALVVVVVQVFKPYQ